MSSLFSSFVDATTFSVVHFAAGTVAVFELTSPTVLVLTTPAPLLATTVHATFVPVATVGPFSLSLLTVGVAVGEEEEEEEDAVVVVDAVGLVSSPPLAPSPCCFPP